jgi:hypothetical protein
MVGKPLAFKGPYRTLLEKCNAGEGPDFLNDRGSYDQRGSKERSILLGNLNSLLTSESLEDQMKAFKTIGNFCFLMKLMVISMSLSCIFII